MNQEDFKPSVEKKEQITEKPKLTLYLLRHGESEKDKTKPNRGLTEKGQSEVRNAMTNIFKDLVREKFPDFNNWDDEEKLAGAIQEAILDVEFHLRDSGTDRTIQQVLLEYDELYQAGVPEANINFPREIYDYLEQEPEAGAGPGITKRLKGIQGVDQNPDYRNKLKDSLFQEQVGATSDMMAWAKSSDDEVPEGIETRQAMEERYGRDIATAERVIKKKTEGYERRVVVIANSHASIATLATAQELSIPVDKLMEEIGEVPNAEGLRYDFYEGDKEHQTTPFGQGMEEVIKDLK